MQHTNALLWQQKITLSAITGAPDNPLHRFYMSTELGWKVGTHICLGGQLGLFRRSLYPDTAVCTESRPELTTC